MQPDWAPAELDLSRPNAARVYDYYLGGAHNFAVDRQMAQQAIELWPDVPKIIAANRTFLRRAVHCLVDAGIDQFLDLGSGIPTVGNVHEVAQGVDPGARVVYVDIDPVAVAHAQAILAGNPHVQAIRADLRKPDDVLARPEVAQVLDLSRPVAVLMVAVFHFVPDGDRPGDIIAAYRDAVPSGSHLAFSHATADGQRPEQAEQHQRLYSRTPTPMIMRTHAEISAFLDGWDLLEPGLVRLPLWRPGDEDVLPEDPETFAGYAAVARKP
ncbi:MAG: hypothetical protein HOV79_19400 [Hamadaea sp.]|nr:hypothetical protein [Hamadaea sp.]